MLVVDRVELPVRHQAQQMREFHCDRAGRLQQDWQSGDEVVQVRHVRQHIIGADQVRVLACVNQPASGRLAEECDLGRHAECLGNRGDVGGRLHAKYGNVPLTEILEKVAIVAGQFYDERSGAKFEFPRHALGKGFGMTKPRLGERREIQVVGEDHLGGRKFLELHQQAILANVGVQRIVRFHRPEPLCRQE
jgi:hypothetical protein